MNTQTENALRMAIEAIKSCNETIRYSGLDEPDISFEAIQACEQALEQPQPRMFLDLSNSNGNHPIEQPAQEAQQEAVGEVVNKNPVL